MIADSTAHSPKGSKKKFKGPEERNFWGRLICLWYTRQYAVSGYTCHSRGSGKNLGHADVIRSGTQTQGPTASEVTTLSRALYPPRHSGNANLGHFCQYLHFDKLRCMLNCCIQAWCMVTTSVDISAS